VLAQHSQTEAAIQNQQGMTCLEHRSDDVNK